MLQFLKKLRVHTKLVPRQYIKYSHQNSFATIFIYHLSFCHLFAITNKSTSCNWNIILKENSHPKSISEVTVVIKYPWLVHMICLIYCFFLFLQSSQHFLTFFDNCVFKLKCFNSCDSLLPFPFGKLVLHQS